MENTATQTGVETMTLTPSQKRILLVLCDAGETGELETPETAVRLRVTHGTSPIRETTTGAALVKKGLAVRLYDGRFSATVDGFWMGDTLRSLDYLGEIPARRMSESDLVL